MFFGLHFLDYILATKKIKNNNINNTDNNNKNVNRYKDYYENIYLFYVQK